MWGIIATWRMAKEGIEKAEKILDSQGDAGDAIEMAIKEVEDFPYYKSVGYGGLPNEAMEVELDAAYMNGDTLSVGAVASLQDFANPISIARRLSHETVNCMLVGQGAESLPVRKVLKERICLRIVLRFIIKIASKKSNQNSSHMLVMIQLGWCV